MGLQDYNDVGISFFIDFVDGIHFWEQQFPCDLRTKIVVVFILFGVVVMFIVIIVQ